MSAADIYSPDPNLLERKFAFYLAQRSAAHGGGKHPSEAQVHAIRRITRWCIGLAALAGILSGGVIGGTEIWMRYGIFDGMDDVGWRVSWPYWAAFYAFVGVVSAVEIAALYALALSGIARITQHSGMTLSDSERRGFFTHSLARAGLEFPNPQVKIYGMDPYAHVANWKLTALNIAYKLKVGVSSFILRVFLRRVAARMAIRGMVPLIAGPLYAVWNAYIIWRIMIESRLRALGPFAVDTVMATHFDSPDAPNRTEADVIWHAAGEMMTRGRDAHPNQIYLMTLLRQALKRDADTDLDWPATRQHLSTLDTAGQTRVLDVLTVSCVIGSSVRKEQTEFLRSACHDCGAMLDADRLKSLYKALKRGDAVTASMLADTRSVGSPVAD